MPIEIKQVLTLQDNKTFIELPYILNKDFKSWVPPLRVSQKEIFDSHHPFWRENPHRFFLAFQNKKCVGRMAAFTNKDHEAHEGRREGFFGFLEAIDDGIVFKRLFELAESFLLSLGCTNFVGPLNPSIHYELGVLVEGFEYLPFFMLTHNMPYYNRRVEGCGYHKLKDFFSYKLDTKDFVCSERMIRVKEILQKKYNLKIRTPNLNDFKNELKIFHELYNDAFVGHWGFSPITWDDFQFLSKDMKMILNKEMILIAEKDNIPIGFLLALPNLNEILAQIKDGKLFPFGWLKLLLSRTKIKSLRVITVAVKHEWQHLGIGSILYPEIAKRAKFNGYHHAELSWVAEDNITMNKLSKEMGGIEYKRYRLYEKKYQDR